MEKSSHLKVSCSTSSNCKGSKDINKSPFFVSNGEGVPTKKLKKQQRRSVDCPLNSTPKDTQDLHQGDPDKEERIKKELDGWERILAEKSKAAPLPPEKTKKSKETKKSKKPPPAPPPPPTVKNSSSHSVSISDNNNHSPTKKGGSSFNRKKSLSLLVIPPPRSIMDPVNRSTL